ncbi:MAG: hypothetical protein JWM91_326 [Rhodospirillales bacterium]|nr:hypothetical protein [Rhodospirillales bacterium]
MTRAVPGPIKPARFEGDAGLAAVKDASHRYAVGLWPILDRGVCAASCR